MFIIITTTSTIISTSITTTTTTISTSTTTTSTTITILFVGVLAGEKQRLGRDYDFSDVIKWFGDRADMIIVMFDAHKLDISDELKTVLDVLKPHQGKIRILLNKADSIDTQSLLRLILFEIFYFHNYYL